MKRNTKPKSKNIERRVKNIVKRYSLSKSLYRDFSNSVKSIIEEIIKKEGLDNYIQIITAREKDAKSLAKKLLNKKFEDNPKNLTYLEGKDIRKFSDIKDLAGVRVILYFKGNALNILRLALQEEFDYLPKDEKKHKAMDGQESIHSLIEFSEERLKLSEYSRFKGLKCEIQLVTILQHAWSELEHDVVYKPQDGWEEVEVEKFKDMFKEAKKCIKEASDIFESIMYIHQNEEKFLLFDEFNSLNNNELYGYLERLEAYMEKKYLGKDLILEDVLSKIKQIVSAASKNKVVKEKNIFGDLDGKTFQVILIKILKVLGDARIKYANENNFRKIFESVIEWSNIIKKDDGIKEVDDFIGSLVRYDLQVLKQIGLFNQNLIVDVLSKWTEETKLKNIRTIRTVASKILQPSFESRSMTEWNKLTFSSGSLMEDKKGNLEKIRKKMIDILFDVYNLTYDNKDKLAIIKTLDEASRTPSSGTEESLEKIILKDIDYLISKYDEVVFNKGDKVYCALPIAMEVERQLLWFRRRWPKKKAKAISNFIKKLEADERYFVYSQLIDRHRFDYLRKTKKINNNNNLKKKIGANKKWLKILNDIAQASDIEEDWKYNDFSSFLTELTESSPKKGEYFLNSALSKDTGLSRFADAFVLGFRNTNNLKLWDTYVSKIEKKQDANLITKILWAYHFHLKNSGKVNHREEDLLWIKNISSRKNDYAFLLKEKYNKSQLEYVLFRVIILIWKHTQKESEKLLIEEMNKSDKNILSQKIDDIELYSSWGDIKIEDFEKKTVNYLVDAIIKSNRFDHYKQELSVKIGQTDFNSFVKIIKERLNLSDMTKKDSKNYDAIPTHLSEKFTSFIEQNSKEFKKNFINWISRKKIENLNSYECGSLLRSLENIHSEIVVDLCKKDNKDSYDKAVSLLKSFNGMNLGLAFAVANYVVNSKNIKSSDKNKLLKYIGGRMYSTGVVSGEHGLSEAHKTKANEIKKLKEEMEKSKKSKKLISFADEMIEYLEDQSKREFDDESRRFRMMEIDFEG